MKQLLGDKIKLENITPCLMNALYFSGICMDINFFGLSVTTLTKLPFRPRNMVVLV